MVNNDKSPKQINDEKLAAIREQLPPAFDSWVSFYNSFKNHEGPIEIVSWTKHEIGEKPKEYQFKIDFIKARCFDEIILMYPQESDFDPFEYGVTPHYIVDRIDKIMGYNRNSGL